MLLSGIGFSVATGFLAFMQVRAVGPPDGVISAGAMLGILVWVLRTLARARRGAASCLVHRNFSNMALAIRLQRPFWITTAALAFIFAAFVPLVAYAVRMGSVAKIQKLEEQRASGKPASSGAP
jgi:hypothetical protein